MMQKKRIHPIAVVKLLALVLLFATWGLGIAGFATGNRDYYRWAIYVFGVLLCLSLAPLFLFALGRLFERK